MPLRRLYTYKPKSCFKQKLNSFLRLSNNVGVVPTLKSFSNSPKLINLLNRNTVKKHTALSPQ